ncbi:MAG: hypothetical protein LBU81_08330 [Methanosarcinales archaeon]|jgi:hypothetical protein|nr:hypothetical protein [Methanosarcinales archaeon]
MEGDNMRNILFAAIGILIICSLGFFTADDLSSDSNFNGSEIFPIPSEEGLYPEYTYKELTEISDLIVMGQFISFEEAKWTTSDGKQPDGVKITKNVDSEGYEYIDFILDTSESIYTDSVFQINEYFKGKADSDKIVIRFYSGIVGMLQAGDNKGLNADEYTENKPVVFYLTKSESKTEDGINYYVIVTPKGALSVEGNALVNPYGEKITFEEIKSLN